MNSKPKTKNFRLRGAPKRRSGATAAKLVAALLDWFAANARDLPWRRTHDPYAIWVSEIMLQQTQVKTVIPFWNRWLRELPTIEAATKASSEKISRKGTQRTQRFCSEFLRGLCRAGKVFH